MIHRLEPFEHWVIDDFLPEEMARNAASWFFGVGQHVSAWTYREHLYCSGKKTRTHDLHPAVEEALTALESEGMVGYLESLTGIKPLSTDPMRFGGGQHATGMFGFLGVHADFTHHPVTGMRRALNLLLYLSTCGTRDKDVEEVDGALELWSPDMKRCVHKIFPAFNRAVIFKTSPTSFHGQPDRITQYLLTTYSCAGTDVHWRPSLAVYYYTLPSPDDVHLKYTDYRPRPQDWYKRLRRRARIMLKGR